MNNFVDITQCILFIFCCLMVFINNSSKRTIDLSWKRWFWKSSSICLFLQYEAWSFHFALFMQVSYRVSKVRLFDYASRVYCFQNTFAKTQEVWFTMSFFYSLLKLYEKNSRSFCSGSPEHFPRYSRDVPRGISGDVSGAIPVPLFPVPLFSIQCFKDSSKLLYQYKG